MPDAETWMWEFRGFESPTDGRPVQVWYDRLPDNHKDEIRAQVAYLRVSTSRLWVRPDFDRLEGEGGISEIRAPDIRGMSGIIYYRIYGFFGPDKRQYTFLHGTEKKVRNDLYGKQLARERLGRLQKDATVHEFDFNSNAYGEPC